MSQRSFRPIIAVTTSERGAWISWILTKYLIWRAGGKAVRLTSKKRTYRKPFNAIILGGGADIDPARYRQKIIETIKQEKRTRKWDLLFVLSISIWILRKIFSLDHTSEKEDKQRDAFEWSLLKEAHQKKIPVLGICRGAQLINVFFGGSLYQDIAEFYAEQPRLFTVLPKVKIEIDPNSKLYKILGLSTAHVNELHNQSVRELGEGLKITARDMQGVVEAIEHSTLPFIGVQWHPEFLPLFESQRRLFADFVRQARELQDNQLNLSS